LQLQRGWGKRDEKGKCCDEMGNAGTRIGWIERILNDFFLVREFIVLNNSLYNWILRQTQHRWFCFAECLRRNVATKWGMQEHSLPRLGGGLDGLNGLPQIFFCSFAAKKGCHKGAKAQKKMLCIF